MDLADKRENKLLILTVWSSVGTVTRILDKIVERVDVIKLTRYLVSEIGNLQTNN